MDEHLLHNFQIRLRTDNFTLVKEILENYINAAEKVLIFRHEPHNENIHFHIYLIKIQITDEALRKKCSKYFKDKDLYSVKKTCGGKKNLPITLEGAYIYATNPKSNSELVFFKGVFSDQLELFEEKSANFYHKEEKPTEINTVVINHDNYYPKQDKTWEMLKDQSDKYIDKNIKQIKSMICAQWLNNGKAIPRPSDLHRYSLSLFYLNKFKDEPDGVPEYALEGEFVEK